MISAPHADAAAVLDLRFELDLLGTLSPIAHGRGDPTIQLSGTDAWLAFTTPMGATTLHLRQDAARRLSARSWGPGATWAIDHADDLVGANDEPALLVARHSVVHALQRRFGGVRLCATRRPFDALLPAILEQKVTGTEAHASYRALVRAYGGRAPGPTSLRLPPGPAVLAEVPYHAFHPLNVERRRADTIRRAAMAAVSSPTIGSTAPDGSVSARLRALRGIGPWTIAEVVRVAYGDPDAVSIGDYHLPSLVCWALAGEAGASEERMLELLEPYRGQRGRVQRLLEASGIRPPRRGPRMAPSQFAGH